MSQIDKLIERICKLPNDIRFDEVRRVLEYYGHRAVAPRVAEAIINLLKTDMKRS